MREQGRAQDVARLPSVVYGDTGLVPLECKREWQARGSHLDRDVGSAACAGRLDVRKSECWERGVQYKDDFRLHDVGGSRRETEDGELSGCTYHGG